MSDLIWKQGDFSLRVFGRTVGCSCHVRNEINGERRIDEVVWTTEADGSRGVPYYPRIFPAGLWEIGRPTHEHDKYLAPFFVPTDARQLVDEWGITEYDSIVYDKPTGRRIWDYAYGLHYSTSMTTLGCIRLDSEHELRRMVDDIVQQIEAGRKVMLEVLPA